jgi:dUTP pyrophosphatase
MTDNLNVADAITVPIKRLDPTVELPQYAYAGDAGLDLRSSEDLILKPFERRLVSTGLAIAIPDGYAGFVQPRSGLALKQGLSMANTPGLIDAHYRGELKICAINLDPSHDIVIKRGDRVAQLVIQKVPMVELVEVSDLDDTDRGAGGFGSSGV